MGEPRTSLPVPTRCAGDIVWRDAAHLHFYTVTREGPANLFIVTNRTTRAGVLQMRVVNAEHDYSGFYPASELEFLQSTTARQAVGRRRVLLAYRAEHSS
jgi:hypothetical protein